MQVLKYTLYSLLLIVPSLLLAQQDSLKNQQIPDGQEDLIEDFIQNSEAEGDFDFNTIYENLETLLRKPLNLNKVSREDLEDFGLLSDIQISSLLSYRKKYGDLIAIYELQAIPNFDLNAINRIRPYVAVNGNVDDYQIPIVKMLYEGQNEIYMRYRQVLEQAKGYTPREDGTTPYLGDNKQLYFRYRHQYENRLSYGFTAEKDPGEEFFTGSNQKGFDFYSAHFYLKDYSKRLKTLALGDYAVSMGQGLILFTGFGAGKSSFVTNVKRNARMLRQYTSVNEYNFFRGAGATLAITDKLDFTAFTSYKGLDANVDSLQTDVIDTEGEDFEEDASVRVTSIQISGLHRTENEIAKRNAFKQFVVGGRIRYKSDAGHFAINTLYNQFDQPYVRDQALYSTYNFRGTKLFNVSADYSYVYQNFHFFGETAMSDNGAVSTLNGLLIGLDKTVDFAILQRHFSRNYQAINANPFAETGGGLNETGVYLGLEIKPNYNWRLSAYYDTFRHPWLRYNADAPSNGYEYFARLTYRQKRRMEVHVQFRQEVKGVNINYLDNKRKGIIDRYRTNLRLQVSNKLHKSIELRNRFEVSFFKLGSEANAGFLIYDFEIYKPGDVLSTGYMIYQDIIYKPVGVPISFTARFALFDTDDYNSRIYAFENDLLYQFSIPAYYNKGTRAYINLRYKGIRNLTIEARIAQTYWANEESIGGGNDAIDGNVRTDVKAQIKYKF